MKNITTIAETVTAAAATTTKMIADLSVFLKTNKQTNKVRSKSRLSNVPKTW